MVEILSIILIVFGVLQIILFFKIWGMTNDIKELKNRYLLVNPVDKERTAIPISEFENKPFKPNDLVINISTDKQMRVKSITADGKYSCYTNNGMVHEGDFTENQIRLFDR